MQNNIHPTYTNVNLDSLDEVTRELILESADESQESLEENARYFDELAGQSLDKKDSTRDMLRDAGNMYDKNLGIHENRMTLAKKYLDEINSKFTEEQIENNPRVRALDRFLKLDIKYSEAETNQLDQLVKIVKIKQFKYSKEYKNMGSFSKLFNNIKNYFKLWKEEKTLKSLEVKTEQSKNMADLLPNIINERGLGNFVDLFEKRSSGLPDAKVKFDKELQDVFDKILIKEKEASSSQNIELIGSSLDTQNLTSESEVSLSRLDINKSNVDSNSTSMQDSIKNKAEYVSNLLESRRGSNDSDTIVISL